MAETDFDNYVIIKFFFSIYLKYQNNARDFNSIQLRTPLKCHMFLIFKTERKSKKAVSSLFFQRKTPLSIPYTYFQQIRDVDLAGNATHALGLRRVAEVFQRVFVCD